MSGETRTGDRAGGIAVTYSADEIKSILVGRQPSVSHESLRSSTSASLRLLPFALPGVVSRSYRARGCGRYGRASCPG